MSCARADAGGVTIDVLVSPRASRARLGPIVADPAGERLKVAVTAPPVEGEANAAVTELIAKALGVPKRAVTILRGDGSRRKSVRIEGIALAQVEAILR